MSITKDFIIEQLKQKISDYQPTVKEHTVGKVIQVGDGIARVSGLSDAMMSEMLEFKSGDKSAYGVVLNLEEDSVGVIILGDHAGIKEGDEVRCLRRILEVPVGEALVGRVVNPLGEALDGKGKVETDKPIEFKVYPGITKNGEWIPINSLGKWVKI